MMVIFSPTKGYFVGCEAAGFGGVEGDPEFEWDIKQALDLSNRAFGGFEKEVKHHLGYIAPQTPDARGLQGSAEDIEALAAALAVHES